MQSNDSSVHVQSQNAKDLKRFIECNSIDLRSLPLQQFREWLTKRVEEASSQELFRLRCWIRDVRYTHRRRLKDRQRRLEIARREYEESVEAMEFARSSREVDSLRKGVAGLTAAVAEGRASADKLVDFQARLTEAEAELLAAQSASDTPKKKRLERATLSWQRLLEEVGLADAETKLQRYGDQQGLASTSSGARFELVSSEAAREFVIPSLRLDLQEPVILHGATLDCPRGEFDQVVVTNQANGIATVHAVVEAKNNINDLAHGFRVRQENLAWFVGDAQGYDRQLYMSERFRNGAFDGHEVTHIENGVTYRFDATSFKLFCVTDHPPYRLDRLFFVTEARPLLGLDSGDLSRVLHRVSTDHRFDIQSDSKLRQLYEWMLEFVDPFQTVDVLRLYARNDALANRILLTRTGVDG